MRIIRVFPRRTKATPTDDLARVGSPELFDEADMVYISVTFTWDLPEAERLRREWLHVAPVRIGGPATGERGEDFVPGKFLKPGYVITSRGCPNRCWFCSVPEREGALVELIVHDGWNVLDDNLLACSDDHIRTVFSMLGRQRRRPEFTGGLEAARLRPWHVEELRRIRARQIFFAYDEPEDLEPLRAAAALIFRGGFKPEWHRVRCYVLIGWPEDRELGRAADTPEAAERRLLDVVGMGMTPMAMYYRDRCNQIPREWWKFRRLWSRPGAIHGRKLKAG